MRHWFDLQQDVAYTLRLIRRNSGFAAAVIATLALGIGATTAIFSVVQGVLLRPLPYPEPARLVRVWEVTPRGADRNVVSGGNYLDWKDRATSFAAVGAHTWPFTMALTGSGDPVTVVVARATPSLFAALGVQPQLGRTFGLDEGEDGGPKAVLLGDRFWRRQLNGNAAVLDSAITLNGQSFTVVGVMPPAFRFPDPETELWVAQHFGAEDRVERRSHNYGVVARLKADAGMGAAGAEMRALARQIAREHPADVTGWSANVVPMHDDLVAAVKPLIVVLFGVVCAVLLVACANLANLMLARAAGRRQEVAVRSALGAGRLRIARQFLTESLLLAIAGGLAGVAVVSGLLEILIAAAPQDIPLLQDVRVDPVVLAFAAAATVLSAVLIGVLPAFRTSRSDPAMELRSARTTAGIRQTRLRDALVVVQVAMALALLVGATLLVRSVIRLNAVEFGFAPERLLAVDLDLPMNRYSDRAAQTRFYEQLLDSIRPLTGVAAATTTSATPAAGAAMTFSFAIQGKPAPNANGREDPVPLRAVTSDYFHALAIPLLNGRVLTSSDRENSLPVAVVNRTLARRFWPDGAAVGHRISFVGPEGPWYEIVGVVGDTRDDGLDRPAPPALYLSYAQKRETWRWLTWQTLLVRAKPGVEPADLVTPIRAALRAADASLPLGAVRTVRELYAENSARRRFAMQLTAGFAVLALVLGAIGIYAVVAYSVAERRREIGIRLALGALPRSVAARTVTGAVGLAALGVAIGTAAAYSLTGFLETLLFGIQPRDPATFGSMAALVLVVAAAAAVIPARRAMRVDPVRTLRAE